MDDISSGFITDVEGIRVGHFTDPRRPTGCTVVLYEEGAFASVDVRGASPGTRETDLLDPVNKIEKVHGILLSGGSAFGLDAAAGVMRYLEERGAGYQTPFAKVPIVPAAILFDLRLGDPSIRPGPDAGYLACLAARGGAIEEGSVGAGAGATVGKLGPGQPMKGGIGTASILLPGGLIVGAIVAVNCVGNVVDPQTGRIVAGSRSPKGGFVDLTQWYRAGSPVEEGNTTIGVIATNAALGKAQLKKAAQMAHDGMARTINPVHTPWDGDTLFAIATATSAASADTGTVGVLAAEAVSEAILRAVRKAKGVAGIPGCGDDVPQP